jgi:hypothetical protein
MSNVRDELILLKQVIQENTTTIGKLYDESDRLINLSKRMKDNKELNTRIQLINKSITDLLNNTRDLFNIYKRLVDIIYK